MVIVGLKRWGTHSFPLHVINAWHLNPGGGTTEAENRRWGNVVPPCSPLPLDIGSLLNMQIPISWWHGGIMVENHANWMFSPQSTFKNCTCGPPFKNFAHSRSKMYWMQHAVSQNSLNNADWLIWLLLVANVPLYYTKHLTWDALHIHLRPYVHLQTLSYLHQICCIVRYTNITVKFSLQKAISSFHAPWKWCDISQ